MREYLEHEGRLLSTAENEGYDHYLKVRERFNAGEHSSYDFLFLSRAGFNGMMRFGGRGNWNIPFCKKPERFSPAYVTKIVNQTRAVAAVIKPYPDWEFTSRSFGEVLSEAGPDDLIYCDPPYFGRHVDYYNGWTEDDEETLFSALANTKARFVLSTWHHNDWRENEMMKNYWSKFEVYTRDHFYHAGAKIDNRRSIVEALVCNFLADSKIARHNHEGRRSKLETQLELTLSAPA